MGRRAAPSSKAQAAGKALGTLETALPEAKAARVVSRAILKGLRGTAAVSGAPTGIPVVAHGPLGKPKVRVRHKQGLTYLEVRNPPTVGEAAAVLALAAAAVGAYEFYVHVVVPVEGDINAIANAPKNAAGSVGSFFGGLGSSLQKGLHLP